MNWKYFLYESYHKSKRFLLNFVDTPAVILIYHRVIELPTDPQQLAVKPDNFYSQIKYLKENFNLIHPEEFANILISGKPFPKKTVILTFDDGYADNYLNAVKILESLNASVLFYITTGMLDSTEEIWWDKLENILLNGKNLPPKISLKINSYNYNFNTYSDSRVDTYNRLHKLIKYKKQEKRNKILQDLEEQCKSGISSRSSHRFLTSDELKAMAKSPSAVIGAHTDSHTPLSILSYKEQLDDVRKSKEILEEKTEKTIEHFSFPYGIKKDYNSDSRRICKELNFKMVCANYYGQVHKWTDRFQLPRILVRDWNIEVFKKHISTFFRY